MASRWHAIVEKVTSLLVNAKGNIMTIRNPSTIVCDCEVKDGVAGAAAFKPDLVGWKGLQDKDLTKATGLYWRPPNLNNSQLLTPVEVKRSWPELVRQAGTYACCLFSASPVGPRLQPH